jgi:hypothetical protein
MYGDVQVVWSDFLKYNRFDGSDPSTVNFKCSPNEWPTSDKKVLQATYID